MGALVLLLGASDRAPASTPSPPVNDNYLRSLELNAPGTHLNRTATLANTQNTTNATVQSDIFGPQHSGGGAEVTSCHGVSYNKTIWYDFFPDANGEMEIQTSGYDNVIALYPYSRTTFKPNLAKERCVHNTSFPSEQMLAQVSKGTAYTVQIGAVPGVTNGVGVDGGVMQVQFDYAVAPPHRLSAQATLTAEGTSDGIKLLSLSVATARTNKVAVDCGRHCRPESKRNKATETFRGLKNVDMPAGSQLHIRITAPKSIGVYIEYDIHKASFNKLTRCLEPGSSRPRKKCQ